MLTIWKTRNNDCDEIVMPNDPTNVTHFVCQTLGCLVGSVERRGTKASSDYI
jgi:hypothetical protein